MEKAQANVPERGNEPADACETEWAWDERWRVRKKGTEPEPAWENEQEQAHGRSFGRPPERENEEELERETEREQEGEERLLSERKWTEQRQAELLAGQEVKEKEPA